MKMMNSTEGTVQPHGFTSPFSIVISFFLEILDFYFGIITNNVI